MDVSCDLEVDVNGEGVFILDKKIICSYSGRIRKLFGKSASEKQRLKLIFHDFPGGADSFELMTRFCYTNGKIDIIPLNLSLLHCTAHFMEMNIDASGTPNLLEQTEKSLEEIRYWTWSELLVALKQCQDLLPIASSGIREKLSDSLVGKIAFPSETSPCASTSSPESFDTTSTESSRNSSFWATWWFEDLVGLNANLIEMVVKSMVSQKLNHVIIRNFLFYYRKTRFILATSNQKRQITETVINMLYSLDWSAIPLKGFFGILRVALNLNISKSCRNKLESMIGSQMDQATLDNLLVWSPNGTRYLYDVNLVLRLMKSFVGKGVSVPLVRLKKAASLMDLYLAEVAPDPGLKPSKFLELVRALPDSARDSYDAMYTAMDMYLEVHIGLSEEEKINVCCGLNYEKLSSEASEHLAENEKFTPKLAFQALNPQKCKLISFLQEIERTKPVFALPCIYEDIDTKEKNGEACEEIVIYAGTTDCSDENEKIRANLQGMQWRVMELEKLCSQMRTQMTKIMKSRSSSNARSLPRLCS